MLKPEPDGKTGLPELAGIFHALRRGRHISSADGGIFTHLCNHFDAYCALLDELGFTLRRHPRDFFYLEDSSHFTEIAGKMALFVFIMVENIADRGLPVEETLMTGSFAVDDLPHFSSDRYRSLMREADIATPEQLSNVISHLERHGFIRNKPDERFEFLTPAYRFLDLCMHYSSMALDNDAGDVAEKAPSGMMQEMEVTDE